MQNPTLVTAPWHWEEGLKLSLVVIGALTAWMTAGWKLFAPFFQSGVLSALKAKEAEYRRWNDSLYADWRKEQLDTDRVAREVHGLVLHTSNQLSAHRAEVKESLAILVTLRDSVSHVEHLAKSIDDLTGAVREVSGTNQDHAVKLALLHQRMEDVQRNRAKRDD